MGEYSHAEAFALMQYRDKETGEIELIWNSRDGVTPFIVLSRAGNHSQHVNWRGDERKPDHVPEIGDRIFVDLTMEVAVEFQRKRFAGSPEMAERLRDHYGEDDETIIQKLVEDMMEPGGQPDVLVVTEEVRERFLTKA